MIKAILVSASVSWSFVVNNQVLDAEPGYLNVSAGDQVRILYIGSDDRQDEHGWVFGATAQCKGWLSVQNLKIESEDACEAIIAKRGALSKGAGYLRIRKGEPLIIKHEENEWLFGWSNEQQQQGWFPRLVLTKPAPPPEEEWEALQNKQKPQFDQLAASAAASTEALAGPESLPSWTVGRRAPKAPWNYAIMDNRRRCHAQHGDIDLLTALFPMLPPDSQLRFQEWFQDYERTQYLALPPSEEQLPAPETPDARAAHPSSSSSAAPGGRQENIHEVDQLIAVTQEADRPSHRDKFQPTCGNWQRRVSRTISWKLRTSLTGLRWIMRSYLLRFVNPSRFEVTLSLLIQQSMTTGYNLGEKSDRQNSPSHALFIDWNKAFDSVTFTAIDAAMQHMGAVTASKLLRFCGFLRAGKGGIDADTAKRWANLVKDGIEDAGGWDRPQGNLGTMSRFTKWLVRSGCSCPYRYGGAVVDATPFPPFMNELMDVVMPLCGFPKEEAEDWPNSCNVNLYADGTDYLDWHADDEPLFGGRHGDCCIISLSLGQERPFQLRLTDCADAPAQTFVSTRMGTGWLRGRGILSELWQNRTTGSIPMLEDPHWQKALPLSAALPSTISERLPELLAVWRLRSVCKAWHRATIRACLLRQDRWTTTELVRVSCSYFEGGGADFLARRLVLGPRHIDDPMGGEAQMIMVKGNTESREAPHEFEHSDGSYVCEILDNERAVLRQIKFMSFRWGGGRSARWKDALSSSTNTGCPNEEVSPRQHAST
ncbi:hypothetical protein AK812_SmicGene43643 [Symbiodinium microadriaticum]|uniref:Alpha-ketoglutarate-dependent dioxygenase AlkB-like domain-containing protein n=1 Tax=Symbiodinium microadriaticum TaxID=2951 RepID=A0A1Q9C0H1_SYMMI|nr:hypothetical protein AK812_SmicGene43643 [Symbiodinium microadriaticum]